MNLAGDEENKSRVCPYLGQVDDSDTAYIYPSQWNRCCLTKPEKQVGLEYQGEYCLTDKHPQCPIYLQGSDAVIPAEILQPSQRAMRSRHPGKMRTILISVGGIVLILMGAWFVRFKLQSGTPLFPGFIKNSPTSLQTMTQTATFIVTPTHSIPTLIPSLFPATPTKTPAIGGSHMLETPIAPNGLVIHRVENGESLESIARLYWTTSDAIKAVNYNLQSPIWVDKVIVVPANRVDVSGLPSFEVFQVTENITIENLAFQLSVSVDSLKSYNSFSTGEIVTSGEWIIIPHLAKATP